MNTPSRLSDRFPLLVAVCMLTTAVAWAGPPGGGIAVSYRDLDLSNSAGAAKLYVRIQAAARSVCGYEATSVFARSVWDKCVRPTVDSAVAKVNNPQLTALHTGRNSSPATAMINR